MLSLKDFKEVSIDNSISVLGGMMQCTGGGGRILWTETKTTSLPNGTSVIESRNMYEDWDSDDGDTKYGVQWFYGPWY